MPTCWSIWRASRADGPCPSQVGEEDYHVLRQEQRLRVDFSSFPGHLVGLFDTCAGETRADGGFLARLETGGVGGGAGSASDGCALSIVETNQFRELTHLSLRVRAGNDVAVKSYLAGRLGQSRAEATSLRMRLDDSEAARLRESSRKTEVEAEVVRLREGRERDLRDLRAMHSAELTAVREEGLRRLEDASAHHARALQDAQLRDREERASLAQRASEAEARRTQLMEANFRLESELQDLRTKHAAGEAALQELGRLRETVQRQETEAYEADKENQRLNLRIAALVQQVEDKQEMADQSAALKSAAEANKGKMLETLEAYKANVVALQDKLEGAVKEINRGNAIIQRLQTDYKTLKHKLQLRTEVAKQQERAIGELKEALNSARNQSAAAAMEQRAAEGHAENLAHELQAAKDKLTESARLMESNQQVITWLNRELNEAQLAPSSRGTKMNFGGQDPWIKSGHVDPNMTPMVDRFSRTSGTPSTAQATPQSGLSSRSVPAC
jgi:spindle assembly abnormal protein 6